MASSTISGNHSSTVTLTTSAYNNPVTITSTGDLTGTTALRSSTATFWTIENAGTVAGSPFYGIYLHGGSSLTNDAGKHISGNNSAIVDSGYGAFSTVINAGSISSSGSFGVAMDAGGTVTNMAGATINGGSSGVEIGGSRTGTVTNFGTITGSTHAVYLHSSGTNLLVVGAGAVFTGNVVAQNNGTIELASSASAGTISSFGTQYSGFQNMTIDSGATWEVTGAVSGFNGETITGFTSVDSIDLTGMSFAAGEGGQSEP
jgi:hypothetical protein